MSDIYQMLIAWLPAPLVVLILGLFALLIVLLVMRIVKIVLDTLPFL